MYNESMNYSLITKQVIELELMRQEEYSKIMPYIDKNSFGAVYPFSIAEMIQSGDVFIDNNAVLFWHYCGFAFLCGEYDDNTINFVYENFLKENSVTARRFVLFSTSDKVKNYLQSKNDVLIGKRYFFEYPNGSIAANTKLPEGFRICEFKKEYFAKTEGRIDPRFSWCNADDFIKSGKGFCVMNGNRIAACAFSAAVSSEEVDIGIETLPDYQHMGLATVAVEKMIQYILKHKKRPVWACDANNKGSQRLAEKTGFRKTGECFTFKKITV